MKMFHNLISTEVPRPAGCHFKLQILDFSDLLTFPMQQLHSHHPPENFPKCIFREQILWLEIRFVDDYPPHQQRIVCCHLQEFHLEKSKLRAHFCWWMWWWFCIACTKELRQWSNLVPLMEGATEVRKCKARTVQISLNLNVERKISKV